MEHLERKSEFDVGALLRSAPGVTNVERCELDEEYFLRVSGRLDEETVRRIRENQRKMDVYTFSYISDGLSIGANILVPKRITRPLPLVIFNHGGHFREYTSIREYPGTAFGDLFMTLVEPGAVVVGSEYRGGVGSEGKDEGGGADLRDVVRLREVALRLPFCKNGNALVVGASRGGMMSLKLAAQEPWVKAVVVIASPTDYEASSKERPEMQDVYDEAFGGSELEKKERSAVHFCNKIPKYLPILVLHGDKDDRVSVEHARYLVRLLKEGGYTVEYHEIAGAGHELIDDSEEARTLISDFITRNL